MANIRIRPAIPEEAGELSDIALRSKAHWGYSQDLLDLWASELAVQAEFCDGESMWVIELDGEIAGFGEIVIDGNMATLDDLWVDPDHMGSGIGRKLFEYLRALAADRGATRIMLEADPNAVGFYEHMGARIVGQVPSESVPGRSLPIMELALTPPENTTISSENE